MRFAVVAFWLGSCGLAGCFTTPQDGTGVLSSGGAAAGGCAGSSCHRANGGNGANGGAAGGAGSSGASSGSQRGTSGGVSGTSGGTSGGGTSGGSGSSSTGGTSGGLDAGINCPDLFLASQVLDLTLRSPIAGATISAVDLNGVTIPGAAASTQAEGYFALCVPTGVEFTVEVTATGYPQSILEDTTLQKSEVVSVGQGGMPLISQGDLTALGPLVSYNSSMGAVVVSVNSQSKAPLCYDSAGWQLSLTLPDGGALAYQRAYLDTSFLPDPALQVTAADGNAFFSDIDPNVTDRVAVVAVNTNANAAMCPLINAQIGFQNTALVASGSLTFAPVMNP